MKPGNSGQSGREPGETGEPEGGAALERASLRAAVAWLALRRRDTPARQLAGEIGIGKSSVDKVLKEGAVPKKNAPKMIRWFLRDRRARYGSLEGSGDFAALVLELLAAVPAPRRAAALRRLVALLEEIHREASAPRPDWLDALHEVLAAEEGAPPPEVRYRPRRPSGGRER